MMIPIENREADGLDHDMGASPGKSKAEIVVAVEAIPAHLAGLPLLDTRSEDEILGYNEQGYLD